MSLGSKLSIAFVAIAVLGILVAGALGIWNTVEFHDRKDFEAVAPVIGAHFKGINPANTTVEARLVDPRMKVEIEVTAYRGP